jgi:MFS family permease
MVSTVAFIGATIGCVFSPTAEILVLFRALQGAGGEAGRGRRFVAALYGCCSSSVLAAAWQQQQQQCRGKQGQGLCESEVCYCI